MAAKGKGNKKTIRNPAVSIKRALCTPYNIAWPLLQADVKKKLLDLLIKCFTTYDLRKPGVSRQLPKEQKKQALEEAIKLVSEENRNLRRQLVVGMASVTRALERGHLRLVLVERSAPHMLHSHLIQLSAVRQCPAICLNGVSQHIAPLLGLTAFVAIGFKRCEPTDQTGFDDVVNDISKIAPEIDLPWLSFEHGFQNTDTTEPVATEQMAEKEPYDELDVDEDYSYLYIYKSDKPQVAAPPSSTEAFIGFADSSEESEIDAVETQPSWTRVDNRRRARHRKRHVDDVSNNADDDDIDTGVSWYRTAKVNQVYPNTKRKKKFDGKKQSC